MDGEHGHRACAVCGKVLPANAPWKQRYCSAKCKNVVRARTAREARADPVRNERILEANRRSKKKRSEANARVPNFKCVQCGAEFHRHSRSAVFCSVGCRAAWKEANAPKRPTASCSRCGREFPADGRTTMCAECREASAHERARMRSERLRRRRGAKPCPQRANGRAIAGRPVPGPVEAVPCQELDWKREVEVAMGLPSDQRYIASKTWTRAQRQYAIRLYSRFYGIFSKFTNHYN